MKVVLFSSIYIDNWGYQENLLPKYFKVLGHEVSVITLNKLPEYISDKKEFKNNYYIDGVEIIRISTYLFLTFTLFFTKGLYRTLVSQKPDILFHHDVCLTSLLVCVCYKILHPKCKLVVDNHADLINKTKSKFWFYFYYKFVLRILSFVASPFVEKFYGVSLSRCDFLETVYKIKSEKIRLLPIGADTLAVDEISMSDDEIRLKYQVPKDDFIVVSGGKMGIDKGTDVLIRAVDELRTAGIKISLILFGAVKDKQTEILIKDSKSVLNMGWCERLKTLELLKMSNVAVWPIHHTTLIEDSIACLTPLIIRKTRTTEHLIDGNGIFIENENIDEIKDSIIKLTSLDSKSVLQECKYMREKIDYRSIVNQIINDSIS